MNNPKNSVDLEASRKRIIEESMNQKSPLKTDTSKADLEYANIKRNRERLLREEKSRQRELRQAEIRAKKHRRIMHIITAVTFALLLIFAPIYPNPNFTINEMKYLRLNDIETDSKLENYFSPYQFVKYYFDVKDGSEYIKSVKLNYELEEMRVNLIIEEYDPLVKDVEDNVYFFERSEVVTRNNLDIYAPIVTGFDQDNLYKLLDSMQDLDYSIIIQIDTIEYIGTEEDPNLLKMGMADGNTIYINMEQINRKMPYYNQIKQIIDEKAKTKPGIIHLDIGDYYEPK